MDIINLSDGVKVPNQLCLVRCHCTNAFSGQSATITHESGGVITSKSVSVKEGGFTDLVRLQPGNNHILAHFGNHSVTRQVKYEPQDTEKFIRLIYVTCLNEEQFQGPKGADNSVNAAVKRIQAGALAMQTFVAESMHEHGFERKTFKLELTPKNLPRVHVLQLPMTIMEVQGYSEEKLWEVVAMQVLSSYLANANCKYIAFLGATRYTNNSGEQLTSESAVVSMTKGHVSLGGGGLALVGTGALYAWPSEVTDIMDAFHREDKVDTMKLMDFSGGRGTYGACFGTHLGSVIHELGHTLDLGHTKHGMMARGFEDTHLFFTKPVVHCAFFKQNLRSCNIKSSLSSSSLIKEPITFSTDFVVKQEQVANINMTVAPLASDYDTMSTDTSSSDATDQDSDGAFKTVPHKCNLYGDSGKTSSSFVSGNSMTDISADGKRSVSPSYSCATTANNSTENLASGGCMSANLTTSLVDLGAGGVNAEYLSEEEDPSLMPRVMTSSFTSLNNSPLTGGHKSLSSMPDLRGSGGFGRLSSHRLKVSVGLRSYWARVNAVMLHTHKWLNETTSHTGEKPTQKGSVITSSSGVRLVELRDMNTLSFHHWEYLGRAPPLLHIPWAQVNKWPKQSHIHLLAMDASGNLLKDCIIPKPL